MKKIIVSQKPKTNPYRERARSQNELIDFVADQFKKLTKKNLRIPIQLYHL